jgi:hypothetical protein
MRARLAVCLLLGIITTLLPGGFANADTLGWSINGTPGNATWSSVAAVDGMEFTPSSPIQVTALGWYDDTYSSPAGLATSHQVGIWRLSDQQLMGSLVVPAGTVAPMVNRFRFLFFLTAPLFLQGGTTYVIAGLGGTQADPNTLLDPATDLTIGPGITIGAWRSGGTTFSFPTSVVPASTRLMGPTFQYVPEPAAALLFMLGSLAILRRRSSR